MVHIGDTSAIDAMRFGTVGTNHQRTATTKSVIPHTGTKKGYVSSCLLTK